MRVNFFTKTKTNIGNLPRSSWKTIEILKTVRFQSLNFTSKPKGYLLQTTKLWERLIVLNRRKKKATKPKEDVNFLSLKLLKWQYFISFNYPTSWYSILLLFLSVKWSLNCSVYLLYKILFEFLSSEMCVRFSLCDWILWQRM